MWATRRRTIILLIIGAFLFVFVILPYWLTHQEVPTCSDGKKNQNELGIDCGGACTLVCPGGAKDLSILWTRVFPVRPGIYDVVAYVENPNFNITAPTLPYTARLYDANGTVIAEKEGQTYAQPAERFAIFVGNMQTGEKVADHGEVVINNKAFRWYSAQKADDTFAVEDKSLTGFDRKPKLTANLHNLTPDVQRDVDVTAIIYDNKGEPIGVSSTHVDKVDRNGLEKVIFTWPAPFKYDAQSEECDAPVDVVEVLDRSGSMVDDGKLEAAKIAAGQFVDRLKFKDQGAYVSFATEASNPPDQPLTNEFDRIKRAIDKTQIKQNEGLQFTNIAEGLQRAVDELASYRHNSDARPVIIMLTDGLPTRPEDPQNKDNKLYPATFAKQVADNAKSQGITLYTIGLGGDVNSAYLESLATTPDNYYKAASGAELNGVYQQIATAMCKKAPSVLEIIPRINNAR